MMATERLADPHDPLPSKPHVKPVALLPIADGSDELEVATVCDVLTRGGIHVITSAVGQKKMNLIEGAHGIKLRAQQAIEDSVYKCFDLIVVPGGTGTTRMRDCELLIRMLKLQKQEQRWYMALSSAPATVLKPHGLLDGDATCHPSKARYIRDNFVDRKVVVSGRCVTSQGPGVVVDCCLTVISSLCGRDEAARVAKKIDGAIP